MNDQLLTLITPPSAGYALLDTGGEYKLERFGSVVVSRPDPQALWDKGVSENEWKSANAHFLNTAPKGEWKSKNIPERWKVDLGNGIMVWAKLSAFKHVGIFPEHAANWQWMTDCISKANRPIKVLNLFGYTGVASLAAAQAGAQVCHVDSSKTAVSWGRDNAGLSGLADKPIRWIVEDVRKFVKRELRRGNAYDAIIMDPPAFGHGADNELWKIEKDLIPLIDDCAKLLSKDPLFVILNGYAAGYSSLAYSYILKRLMENREGIYERGELTIQEDSKRTYCLPCGIVARWKAV